MLFQNILVGTCDVRTQSDCAQPTRAQSARARAQFRARALSARA
jgi:hypothetical protein